MTAYMELSSFRILDLPVELIVEIAIWAQLLWQEEVLPIRVPRTGMKRLPVQIPRTAARHEACCRSLDRTAVPCCSLISLPQAGLSPARCMAQTCARLRSVLLLNNTLVWVLDNALYKRPGASTDTGGSGAAQNVAENLVVLGACTHALRPVKLRFPHAKNARLALPWDDPEAPTRNVEEFFLLPHHQQSNPLQHLDLEIYDCPRAYSRPRIRMVQIDGLQTYRSLNSSVVCYSAILTTMEICHPFTQRARFGRAFLDALAVCASTLQHLSIDAPNAAFTGLGHIAMTELRYFRLVAPAGLAISLLRALVLPAALDVDLEPVYDWRIKAFNYGELSQRYAVPFAEMDEDVASGPRPYDLWRYMSALAAPEATAGIFRYPPQFTVRNEGLWPKMIAMGLDVRLDPSTTAFERACRRFPEYVSVTFAGSRADIEQMHQDPDCPRLASASLQGRQTARRSLCVRDGTHSPRERVSALVPSMPTPVYDFIRYVLGTALLGKPHSSFAGISSIRRVYVHPRSWLPTFGMGWGSFFDAVGAAMRYLKFGCPLLGPDAPFAQNMEGCLAPAHLDSFAVYLNDFANPLGCPCPRLAQIHLQSVPPGESREAAAARLGAQFNSTHRRNAGAPRIAFLFGDR